MLQLVLWTVLFAKSLDRGSVATAACCCFAYALAANLFPRIPTLIGMYNSNVMIEFLNIEIKITTVALDFLDPLREFSY